MRLMSVLLLLILATSNTAPVRADVSEDIKNLTANPSRMPGAAGYEKAAEYVEQRFRTIGLDNVGRLAFSTTMPVTESCWIELDGAKIVAWPVWPNSVSLSSTSKEGLSGSLFYGGDGQYEKFDGKTVKDQIAVMEFNSLDRWKSAGTLGAKAVLYLEPDDTTSWEALQKFDIVPVNMHRFWVPKSGAAQVKAAAEAGKQVKIVSICAWKDVPAYAVYGWLNPAKVPELDKVELPVDEKKKEKEPTAEEIKKRKEDVQLRLKEMQKEVIILEACFDSTSVVPDASPGALQAANMASLLALAEDAASSRGTLKRPILFVANSAKYQLLEGDRSLFWTLTRKYEFGRGKAYKSRKDEIQHDIWRDVFFKNDQGTGWADILDARLYMDHYSILENHLEKQDKSRRLPELLLKALRDQCDLRVSNLAEEILRLGYRKARGTASEDDLKNLDTMLKERNTANVIRYKIGAKPLDETETQFVNSILDGTKASLDCDLRDMNAQRAFLSSARTLRRQLGERKPTVFISLDISDAWNVMSVFGPSHYWEIESPYVVKTLLTQTSEVADQADKLMKADPSLNGVFDIQVIKGQRGWRSFLPGRRAFNSEVGLMHGVHSMTLATIQDPRHRLDTPLDRADRLNLENITRQLNFARKLIPVLVNNERFGQGRSLEKKVGDVWGKVYLPGVGTSIPQLGISYCHAVIAPLWWLIPTPEVRSTLHITTRNSGDYWVRGLPQEAIKRYWWGCYPYQTDEFGRVELAPDAALKVSGYSYAFPIYTDRIWPKSVAFRGMSLSCFRLFDPAYLEPMAQVKILDARRNAEPRHFFVDHRGDLALCVAQKDTDIKILGIRGAIGNRMVLLDSKEDNPDGDGYRIEDGRLNDPLALEAVRSMFWLDEDRLENLRACGITSPLLDDLHSMAGQYLRQSEEAFGAKQYHKGMGLSGEAWALESRTYPTIIASSNGAIRSVVFLLVLVIPFSYFLERLLFGVVNIYRRIAVFTGLFLVMFMILYKVHPAFKLSMAPVTILLAFFILCMSSLVIFIMFRKFEEQVKSLQGKGARLHQADIGRLGAAMAAVSLGIGNMRRRKVRTSLTTATLVMIAFCVLGFASFRSILRYSEWPVTKDPMRRGLMINQIGWRPLTDQAFADVLLRCRGGATAFPRYWLCDQPNLTQNQQSSFDLEVSGPSGKSQVFKSVLGLEAGDALYWGVGGALDGEGSLKELTGDERVCLLPSQPAKELGVTKAGDFVEFRGMKVKVVGIINESKFEEIKGLNDESITPVDFVRESTRKQEEPVATEKLQNLRFVEEKRYLHMVPELVVVVPPRLAWSMGGELRAISVVPGQQTDVWELAESLARELFLPIYVSTGEEVKKLSSAGMASAEGLSDLILPLVIGALVVLNTMIGAVSERGREIFIYSSIGLAPVHVALLFFAEAAVYAVVGGVGGYLLGQVVTQALSILEGFDLAPAITLDYSSMSAVATMFLVVFVTLGSTVYPAIKAARAAIPGRSRKWKLSPPKGDVWDIECPFTLGARDAVGIVSFLVEDFANHRESSVGTYFSEGGEIFARAEQEVLGIKGTTWLAPFDLGVSQTTEITAGPSDIPGIFQVRILLHRLSGDYGSWKRCNRAFLSHVRKQFLLWRTVHPEVAGEYFAKTVAKLDVPFIEDARISDGPAEKLEPSVPPAGEASPA